MFRPLIGYISKNRKHVISTSECICLLLILTVLLRPGFAAGDVRPGPRNLLNDLLSSEKTRRLIALRYITTNTPADLLPYLADKIVRINNNNDRSSLLEVLKIYPSEDAVPHWVKILEKSKSITLKETVIKNLAEFNDRRSFLAIAQELKNPHITVRQEAARALQRADDRAYPYILDMTTSENPVYRIYAIEAFFYMYDRRFYDTIVAFLSDENKSVRIYALRCICANKLNKALKEIRSLALNDSNDEVRTEAVRTLGIFRDSSSLGILYTTLTHANNDIRHASVESIQSIGYKSSAHKLSEQLYNEDTTEIKKAIIDALIAIKQTGNISGLQKILLKDPDIELRVLAAYALGYIRNTKGLHVVIEALKDRDFRVRAEACAALGSFGNRNTIKDLLELVSNDTERYTRSAALYAIKKIDDRKSVLPLYDIYALEKDPVFKEQMRGVIRYFIDKYL